ncbi:MAG TPA: DUF167 domain-containing protein [Thermoanaerobaculia bacterium]
MELVAATAARASTKRMSFLRMTVLLRGKRVFRQPAGPVFALCYSCRPRREPRLPWLVEVDSQAPPIGGKANEELIALVAAHFRCRKAAVTIRAGASGRNKLVRVEAP